MPCLSNYSLKLPLNMAKHRRALLSARKMPLGLLHWMFWLRGHGKKPSIQLWSSWPGNAIFTPLHRARWHLGNPIRCCRYAIRTAALKTRPLLFRRLQRPLLGTAISCSSDCFLLFPYLEKKKAGNLTSPFRRWNHRTGTPHMLATCSPTSWTAKWRRYTCDDMYPGKCRHLWWLLERTEMD